MFFKTSVVADNNSSGRSIMPSDKPSRTPIQTGGKSAEELLDEIKKAIPWLGDAVQKAIRQPLDQRELARVVEVLQGVASDIAGISSELSELYVKTTDFERIMGQILSHVAEERREEKRNLYRVFLSDAIASPCEPLDKHLRMLRILNELRLDQVKLLTVLASRPNTFVHRAQTPVQMLQSRLPDIHRDRIDGLLAQLDELGIIRVADLNAAVAAGQPTGNCITPLGRQLLRLMRPRP